MQDSEQAVDDLDQEDPDQDVARQSGVACWGLSSQRLSGLALHAVEPERRPQQRYQELVG